MDYLVERPDELRRRWETGCPPAGLDKARPPTWALDRWKVVRDLIVGWYGDDRPDGESAAALLADRAGWLDPVQRLLVERLFAGWRAMFPKEPDVEVDVDPPAASVYDHERGIELKVAPTIGFGYPDGSVERMRLRTGRARSGPDDAAVLALGSDQPVFFLDALVGTGAAEEIVAPDDAADRIADLFDLAARDRRRPLRPGRHCFGCASAPRCRQYPLTSEGRVYVSTRSITVSKTQLGWIDTCHRRVAWDCVHQVTVDDDGDVELRSGLATGLLFHETAAAAILSDDPGALMDGACRTADPSEAAELQRLWANHLRLWDEDGGPESRATEYPAGFTLLAPGIHVDSKGRESTQPVAITMIGILDVTGREPDGTPMVIEHRTGRSRDHGHLELDLYMVSAAEAVRRTEGEWPEKLAVHLHSLGSLEPECHRNVADRGRLEAALQRLSASAATIASWHPHDSLSPDYHVGPWCERCRHRTLCEQFR